MIRLLFWARMRSLWNGLTRAVGPERGRARRGLLFAVLVGLAVGFLGYGFIQPFAVAAADDDAIRMLLSRAPALALFSAFWLLVLSGVTAGIQTFYLNPEIGLLLAAPVRPAALFTGKLLEATAANAALFLSTAAPVLVAYGIALNRLTAGYILALALVLLAFSVLPTGIGVLASMVLMRVLPAGRTRDALAAAGVAVFALIYFGLSTGVTRIQHADQADLRGAANRILTLASSPTLRQGPWAWAGDALGGALSQGGVWIRIGMLSSLAAGSVALCSFLAPRLFFTGWAAAQEADSGSGAAAPPRRIRLLSAPVRLIAILLPPPMRAVYVKDMLSLTRDMRQLSMLFIPIAVIGVFIANLRSNPVSPGVGALLFVQTLLIILAPISLRLALAAFIAENRAFWLILEAPNPSSVVLLGKFAFASTLSLPLSLLAAAAYAWAARLGGLELAAAAALVTCSILSFCGIGIGASARFCDFSAETARFTMSSGGRLAVFGIQLVYMLVVAALNLGTWILIRMGVAPVAPAILAEILAAALLSGTCVALMLAWGAARLRKLEW